MKKEETFIPKTKYKALKIMLAILLIGALIAGGYLLYKDKFCNPNKTVTTILEDIEKEAKNEFKENNSKLYKLNGVLKVDANISPEYKPYTEILKNMDMQFSFDVDESNKILNGVLNTKYKEEQLLDINMFLENDTLYMSLKDVYDKYLKFTLNDITKEKDIEVPKISINEEDIKTITNSVIKALKASINDLEFKRLDTTIKIDNKDVSVYNNYVDLQNEEIKKLLKDIVNTLSNDSEFNVVFKKLAGENASVTDLIKDIDNSTFTGTYRLSFYTNKSIINQKLVSIRIETTNDNVTSSINIDRISNDEVLFSINTSGGAIITRIKKNNSVFNFNLNVNILGATIKLDLSSNYEKIKEVNKPDVSNSKDINELTIEDEQDITKKMLEIKGMATLTEDLSKLFPAP